MAQISYDVLNHPNIGTIRGIRKTDRISQYLGVRYAMLKDRFSQGEIQKSYLEPAIDATNYGPLPIIPDNGLELEYKLIQKSLPSPTVFHQSDTECLTLNITGPSTESRRRNLPVLAFLHGGGFTTGSSSFPHYDMSAITEMSLECGMPIIAVGINYRVGIPGFLHSSVMSEAGYQPNNGLDDQCLALQWIKVNIGGFGGDPDRITLVGESAGAASGLYHFQSTEKLFDSLVVMSAPLLQFRPRLDGAERIFKRVGDILDSRGLSPQDQLNELLSMESGAFFTKFGRRVPVAPVVDGNVVRNIPTFKDLLDETKMKELFPAIRHCKRIIVGDCQMDGIIYAMRIAARTDIFPRTLATSLRAVFDPIDSNITPSILSAYELDTSDTSNSPKTIEAITKFGNDVMFALPTEVFARGLASVPGTETFLYHFECPNPWDGRWKGHATHALDLIFALQNYNDFLGHGQRQCAQKLGKDLIVFVNGENPWPMHHSQERGAMIYSAAMNDEQDSSKFIPDQRLYTGRRDALEKILSPDLYDKLVVAWQNFMDGPQ